MSHRIALPRIVQSGAGSINKLGDILQVLQVCRPLIVTDPFMASQPAFQKILGNTPPGTAVFSDTVSDPTDTVIAAGTARLQDGDFDSIIAFGGGSPIDSAKAMSILAKHGGHIRDYKVPQVTDKPGLPVIAVPTTAGTGSEATQFTVITDTRSSEKMLIKGLACLPVAAILDYEFTYSVPFRTTADTGIDSLCHAIEAYVSKRANPFSDTFALSAMKRLYQHIKTACHEPSHATAREEMMLGAFEGGVAFSNASVCLVHGMSRPLGAHFHIPHGLSNAMLLPAVIRFSLRAAPNRFADCARAMGVADDTAPIDSAGQALLAAVSDLNTVLKVPTPADYGIDKKAYTESIPVMAAQALASGSPANNPRVATAEQIASLYKDIWQSVA